MTERDTQNDKDQKKKKTENKTKREKMIVCVQLEECASTTVGFILLTINCCCRRDRKERRGELRSWENQVGSGYLVFFFTSSFPRIVSESSAASLCNAGTTSAGSAAFRNSRFFFCTTKMQTQQNMKKLLFVFWFNFGKMRTMCACVCLSLPWQLYH